MLLLISDGKTADVRCFEKSILVPKGKPRFFALLRMTRWGRRDSSASLRMTRG